MTSFYGGGCCSGGTGEGGNSIESIVIKDGVLYIKTTDGVTVSGKVEGDSAYDSYLNTNPDNPMTEEEWLQSLVGKQGVTFIPDIDTDTGVLSWSNDGNLPNPPDVDLIIDTSWGDFNDSPQDNSDFKWGEF